MSDLDTEIRQALRRATGPIDNTDRPAFEQLMARRRRRRMHRAALAVVPGVLVVVLAVAGLRFVVGDDDTTVTAAEVETADQPVDQPEADSPDGTTAPVGESLIVWLDVGVTPARVAAIAEVLGSLPAVDDFRYIGPEETWREFTEYFADEPEVIELVEPGQLPTSFVVISSDPPVVAAAVEVLAGVDQAELAGQTVGSPLSEELSEQPAAEQVADPGLLASVTGAETIVFGGPVEPIEIWDKHLLVWQDGATRRIGPFSNPWISNRFVVDRASDSGPTRIHDLTGRMVCETRLPDRANVHHVTGRADGTVVLGIELSIQDEADFRTEAYAYDCQTGDRTPIEPFTEHSGEVEWVRIERIGGRVFEVHGDAEGNADRILNEAGVDIVGDDWAGWLAWSVDGSILAYGDHRNAASPHFTSRLVVRNTDTGEFLWATELPHVIARLAIIGDKLVVGLGQEQAGRVPTQQMHVYDLRLGEQAGEPLVIDNPPPGLIYLD